MKAPIRVTITGAAGQIGYATLFRIANGDMLGHDQPVILQLLDLPQAQTMLHGVMMELEDCAFPLLQQVIITDDPRVAFRDTEIALLIGARPRGKGMERKDLLEANGAIFSEQGKLLNEYAAHRRASGYPERPFRFSPPTLGPGPVQCRQLHPGPHLRSCRNVRRDPHLCPVLPVPSVDLRR